MEILLRLIKLGEVHLEWLSSSFTDDPKLDDIYPGLRSAIVSGDFKVPGFAPTISIDEIKDENNVAISCIVGLKSDGSKRTILTKKFNWNLHTVNQFLDYVKEKDIDPC